MNVFCCSYEIRMALKNVMNRAGSNIKKNFRGNINHRKFVYTGAIFFYYAFNVRYFLLNNFRAVQKDNLFQRGILEKLDQGRGSISGNPISIRRLQNLYD